MSLVDPLDANHDSETRKLAEFFNETLGFCPNSVLTMQHRPAISKAFINLNMAVMANEGGVSSDLKRMMAWVSSPLVVAIVRHMPFVLPSVTEQIRSN